MNATLDHLQRLYAHNDDPWDFENSSYEQGKFAATRDALTRNHYRTALELGCGNGALARHLAPLCDSYIGLDAVERAVVAARRKVPGAEFTTGCYPCPLPGKEYELVVLSEVLYFLTPEDIALLCRDIAARAPRGEILCITFLGDTEQALQGDDALALFQAGLRGQLNLEPVVNTGRYRIDRGLMERPA